MFTVWLRVRLRINFGVRITFRVRDSVKLTFDHFAP